MKTHLSFPLPVDHEVSVTEVKGGGWVRLRVAEKASDTTVDIVLGHYQALTVKRGLARLVDANVADPNEGGFSIKELVAIRRSLPNLSETPVGEQEELLLKMIDAYIRLIERTVENTHPEERITS